MLRVNQRRGKEFFLFRPVLIVFCTFVCTSTEQGTTVSLQADIRVDDGETTTTNAQATAHEEFARPPKNRQQQRVTSRGAEQTKQFDPGGYRVFFPFQMEVNLVYCLPVCLVWLCLFCFLVYKVSPSMYERRENFSIEDGIDWDAQIRWMKQDIVISICVNEGYNLYHVDYCPPHDQ